MLVDEHSDMATGLELAHEPYRRVEPSWDEVTHATFAELDDGVAHRADVGSAVKHRRIEPKLGRN